MRWVSVIFFGLKLMNEVGDLIGLPLLSTLTPQWRVGSQN